MNDPKTFYRELDSLLAKIGKETSSKNFLPSIFIELEHNFGDELQIIDGCIYEQRDKDFLLIYSLGKNPWTEKIPLDSPAIQRVIEHGSFIYDNGDPGIYFELPVESKHITPAAIAIQSSERQWIIVFGLKAGWIREEITLFLNAVKTALNYRLFSEIIGNELKQAVQIQKSLLPRTTPQIDGFDVYGRSIPAELVGGDFYEYFDYEDGNFGIGIGDASGHGLPAALLVRDVVIGLRMGLANEYKIVHTVKKLNKVIQRSTYASNFVSLFLGEFEKNGNLFYVNAGHPAPFMISGEKISDLGQTGIVLGFLKEIKLQRSYIHFDPGSLLVMYSDGIIERQDNDENLFGVEQLKKVVYGNQTMESKKIVEEVFKTVYEFGNSMNWEDDATVVVIKRL
jgi:sigma-B regulation protein RsbU (phosphoserine phosphatase)